MNTREVSLILRHYGKTPIYATEHSAGADLFSANANDVILLPGERKLIPTGVCIELPEDSEAQVRPRSGLALKQGVVTILGTIDADYQGEIGIILINLGSEPFIVHRGERLAQLVFNGAGGLYQAQFKHVTAFERESERGEGGFGHTGI